MTCKGSSVTTSSGKCNAPIGTVTGLRAACGNYGDVICARKIEGQLSFSLGYDRTRHRSRGAASGTSRGEDGATRYGEDRHGAGRSHHANHRTLVITPVGETV